MSLIVILVGAAPEMFSAGAEPGGGLWGRPTPLFAENIPLLGPL